MDGSLRLGKMLICGLDCELIYDVHGASTIGLHNPRHSWRVEIHAYIVHFTDLQDLKLEILSKSKQ
jgi:hypothetical protein